MRYCPLYLHQLITTLLSCISSKLLPSLWFPLLDERKWQEGRVPVYLVFPAPNITDNDQRILNEQMSKGMEGCPPQMGIVIEEEEGLEVVLTDLSLLFICIHSDL